MRDTFTLSCGSIMKRLLGDDKSGDTMVIFMRFAGDVPNAFKDRLVAVMNKDPVLGVMLYEATLGQP